jgi:hypothetical protein
VWMRRTKHVDWITQEAIGNRRVGGSQQCQLGEGWAGTSAGQKR